MIPMKLFGFNIETNKNVYGPRDDTLLMAEELGGEVGKGDRVLDVGTGTGLLALVASEKAEEVLGVDIGEEAVELAEENARNNFVENVGFKTSDLFDSVGDKTFDLIVFNPPYLPGEEEEDSIEGSEQWYGGANGREVIAKFARNVEGYLDENGRILLLVSSKTGLDETKKLFEDLNFKVKVVEREKLAWETLFVLKIRGK